ncbi:MAG: DoxX family protein [Candidatus Cyclobacteriaceae bacterium M3_2C_046]
MRKNLNPSVNIGILIGRIAIGIFMIIGHGWPKLINFEKRFNSFADPIGLGSEASYVLTVFAEFLCSILLAAGLYTRLAAIPLIINMAVAAFIVHGPDPWSKKEMAVLYLTFYILLLFTGPGRYSLDHMYRKNY